MDKKKKPNDFRNNCLNEKDETKQRGKYRKVSWFGMVKGGEGCLT